ncbi:MAG: hypothetical protein ACTSWQ_08495 [Candidatus Thorarchaeota archaeon]
MDQDQFLRENQSSLILSKTINKGWYTMRAIGAQSAAKQKVLESRDVNTYKKLLTIFGNFCDEYPASSVDRIFNLMIEKGARVLPSEKRARAIIDYVVSECESGPMKVQKILNMRLCDLPVELRPLTKTGKRHEIAFWCRKDQIYDKVKDLLNLEDGGSGHWGDADCKKVILLDVKEKND